MHWDKQRTNAQRPMPKAPVQILAQEQKFLNTLTQKLVLMNFFDFQKILKSKKKGLARCQKIRIPHKLGTFLLDFPKPQTPRPQ